MPNPETNRQILKGLSVNSNWKIGYCTNVHAGTTVEAVLENLSKYCLPVKEKVSPDQPLGIGLWFGVTDSALRPWSGPIVAIVFLGGHAVFHVVEMFAHHLDARAVARDMVLIVIPAAIAVVWLAREIR